MIADQAILQLLKVTLQTKQLLPEVAGIYYVIDENNNVWYIGKAKNLCKRWQGKSHHRIYQLQAQKKKHFTIYYEQVSESQLDDIEKQRIAKYHPHLNYSPVKTKQIRPTETLLRESIVAIADFAFILGVEPPRKEVNSQNMIQWLVQKKVLTSSVIHICIDIDNLEKKFNFDSIDQREGVIKKAFTTRKVYANKWESFPPKYPFMYRLLVNRYVIEVNYWSWWYSQQESEEIREYTQTTLARESIRTLTPESLAKIQNQSNKNQEFLLKRLKPYDSDLIKLIFNEPVDSEGIKSNLNQINEDYKTGKRGVGSRSKPIKSKPISLDFTTIEELLIYRGIDPDQYDTDEVISLSNKRKMGLFLKCFNGDVKSWSQINNRNTVYGILNNKKFIANSDQVDNIYLLAGVDRKAWLLVEKYLQEFAFTATTKLNNGVGYVEKFYISPRRYIIPAKVNIKLETMGYNVWIPFGMSENFPQVEPAAKEIRERLKNADLPGLKLAFKSETIF